uniref:Uncharacterized protein n=1 Tax=Rhizophora mucronata TaxID=61149 RepID=A0A2P2NSC2_RHIMU
MSNIDLEILQFIGGQNLGQ